MAEAEWKTEEKSSSLEKINSQVRNLSLGDRSVSPLTGARRKTVCSSTSIARALVSPTSLKESKVKHLSPTSSWRSSPSSSAVSPKYPNALSKIPIRQRLSTSDSAFETSYGRKNFVYSNGRIIRTPVLSSSSSDSQSSETKRLKVKDRFLRSSDPCPEKGFFLPYGLRAQHAAHKCAWSESDNCSAGSLGNSTVVPGILGSMDRGRGGGSSSRGAEVCSVHSSKTQQGRLSTNSNPRSGASSIMRRQRQQHPQSKFDFYMPLCEVQQGLKRGEIIEGILRVNPRNYEDSYISAPDGLMDIYIRGIRDRNRALNGDVVAVQLKPPQDWKILWDVIKDYEERIGRSIFVCESQETAKPEHVDSSEHPSQGWASGWLLSEGQRTADSLEILGLDKLQLQFQEFTKEIANKKTRNRSKKNRLHQKQAQGQLQNAATEAFSPLPSSSCNSNSNDHAEALKDFTCMDGHILVDNCNSNFDNSNSQVSLTSNDHSIASPLENDINSPSIQISPTDLETQPSACENLVGESIASSSEDELFPKSKAVAPDELSGDEFSNSISGESVASQQLVQDIEDAEFFAEHQDACNNNEPSENFPVDLNIDKPVDPATEIQNLVDQARQLSMSTVLEPVLAPSNSNDTGNANNNFNCDTTDRSLPIAEPSHSLLSLVPQAENSAPENAANDSVEKSKRKQKKRKNRKHGKRNKEKVVNKHLEPESDQIFPPIQSVPVITPGCTPQRNNNHKKNEALYPNITVADILALPEHDKFLQKTGQVVYIIEKKHSRAAMGYIKKQQDNNPYWAMFSPTDHRLPRILIPMPDCPKDFFERPEDFKTSLFIAMIKEWDENSTFARGRLARSLGEAGEIEPETEGILVENDIVSSEFSEECLKGLPALPWHIPKEELEKRRDLRNQCIFTIDPKTARDLDDAISVREIEDGLLEVGVHIADVSFFVKEYSALDTEASQRATSVYLVQKVIPMLPRVLCEELCSLNPGQDKLTFSVMWKITPDGNIMDEWFGRTVIHSCTKFSYEHAQDMIENGERDWGLDELPTVHGPHTAQDILWCIQKLQPLALNLRQRRFDHGALRLDQIKIQFSLNNETGMPSGFSIYEQKDSHRLIEELMLLANMAVAHKIYKAFPDKAFLRCHPPPQTKMITGLVETCATLGIHLDPSTAGTLQASLSRYFGDDPLSFARGLVLTHLCSKPMKPARYFCSGWTSSPEEFHHYALNVPLYTHFTSPIRRYPDVIVHRLLAAALGLDKAPSQTAVVLQKLSVHCNDKKMTAKRVHELSCELFLGCFIREVGPLEEDAVVVDIMDHSFDVLILRMGVIKRVYCDKLSVAAASYEKKMGIPKLSLTWATDGSQQVQHVTIFTMVRAVISSIPKETMKFNVIIKPPKKQPDV